MQWKKFPRTEVTLRGIFPKFPGGFGDIIPHWLQFSPGEIHDFSPIFARTELHTFTRSGFIPWQGITCLLALYFLRPRFYLHKSTERMDWSSNNYDDSSCYFYSSWKPKVAATFLRLPYNRILISFLYPRLGYCCCQTRGLKLSCRFAEAILIVLDTSSTRPGWCLVTLIVFRS